MLTINMKITRDKAIHNSISEERINIFIHKGETRLSSDHNILTIEISITRHETW